MFELEIKNKCMVELYDNRLNKLTSGIITGFKDKFSCIVIDDSVIYPVHNIAKIMVHTDLSRQTNFSRNNLQNVATDERV